MIHSAIDQILAALAVDVREFAICEFASDTAIEIRPLDEIEVHFVLTGTLYLVLEDGHVRAIPSGGVALVPPYVKQIMGGSPTPEKTFLPAETFSPRRDGLRHYDATKGAPSSALVACGQIKANLAGSFGPFDGLKKPIYSLLAEEPMIRIAFETMLQEARVTSMGSRALIGALMKSCLILALRRSVELQGSAQALPGLFERPSLARVVAEVMENPAASHTLVDLARSAGMSRSKFAKLFVETIGSPPMEFVARTRLHKARDLLLSTTLSVSEIANRVGFASRSHFSRAFRSAFGVDPSRMRRAQGNVAMANG